MKIHTLCIGDIHLSVFRFDLMDARMYVLQCGNETVILDPCMDEDLPELLAGTDQVRVILTHEHFDHISGVNWLRQHCACRVIAGAVCAEILRREKNGTAQFPLLFLGDRETYHAVKSQFTFPYHCTIDETFQDKRSVFLGDHCLQLYETPGHSPGSITAVLDGSLFFAGDNLLGNGYELKSAAANKKAFGQTLEFYRRFCGKNAVVFPGHGEPGPLEEFLERIGRYTEWN